MKKKKAILIISGSSSQQGLAVGDEILGTGQLGIVYMIVTSFKHQTKFADKPIRLEVKTKTETWFDDEYPVTKITYNNSRSKAEVTTCTFY